MADENKGKAGGKKRSWKLVPVIFDLGKNTLNSTRYVK